MSGRFSYNRVDLDRVSRRDVATGLDSIFQVFDGRWHPILGIDPVSEPEVSADRAQEILGPDADLTADTVSGRFTYHRCRDGTISRREVATGLESIYWPGDDHDAGIWHDLGNYGIDPFDHHLVSAEHASQILGGADVLAETTSGPTRRSRWRRLTAALRLGR